MPARSKAQQHLMAAAEHGADFPMAKKVRASMSRESMHDFAATPTKKLPEHTGEGRQHRERAGRRGQ